MLILIIQGIVKLKNIQNNYLQIYRTKFGRIQCPNIYMIMEIVQVSGSEIWILYNKYQKKKGITSYQTKNSIFIWSNFLYSEIDYKVV